MVPTPLRDCGAGASVEAVGGLAPSTDDAEPLRPASPARRTTEVAAAPASREDSFLIPSLPLHNRSQVDHDLLLPSPACAWAEGPCSLLHPVLPALPEPHLPPTSPHRPPLPATAPHTTTAPAPAPAVPSLSSGSSLDRGASAAPSSRGASAPLQGEPEVISAATLPCPMSYAYVATGPSAAVSGSTPAIPAAQAPAVKRLRLVGVPPQVAAPAPAIGASAGSAAVLEAPASTVAAAPAAAAGGARGKRRATAAAAAAAVAVMARGELSDEDTDEDYDAQEEAMGGAGRAPKRARKAPGAGGVRMPAKPPRTGVTCRNCGAKETPQWRCGPEGPRTLCNACGVRFKKGLPLAYMERKKREGRMGL
ncbi:hypothetical protein HYH03_001108 [Edaphochlamys debaryana]|uniref:GATA-type domain-containing protein n=1 Tax=Edaphochlamys debaryana TaxID=47281 RepID=A0A835YGG7_9CHLO|nr:hypothetical protein HYH03_001108 [Edaphochlamys debaryana]|eukprot:KAG2501314.1 hypothetical protein HYH03_001108 [Edaphochlamys debaryana]